MFCLIEHGNYSVGGRSLSARMSTRRCCKELVEQSVDVWMCVPLTHVLLRGSTGVYGGEGRGIFVCNRFQLEARCFG